MDDAQRPGEAGAPDPAKNSFIRLPIEVRVTVGRARPTVEQLLSMTADAVLPLDRSVSDPVELYVGDKLIARGVLEEVEGDVPGQLAVRLLEVADDRDVL